MKRKNSQKIKATLTLGLLAAVLGEILTGSSPPLTFFRPVYFLFLLGMYGGGVLLVREFARSRRLGWINIAILGAAYGLIEEGLIITSFYNPRWGGVVPLGGKGFLLGINWIWALYSVSVHIFLTVFSSIVLTEALFPKLATKAWLTPSQRGFAGVVFLLSGIFGFHLFVNTLYPNYSPPTFSYLLIATLTAILIFAGLKVEGWPLLDKEQEVSHLKPYFLAGFGIMTLTIIIPYALTKMAAPSLLTLFFMLSLIFAGGILLSFLVKKHAGWSRKDRLALTAGILTPWLIRLPLLELQILRAVRPMNLSGLTITALIIIALLAKGFR